MAQAVDARASVAHSSAVGVSGRNRGATRWSGVLDSRATL